MDSVSLTLFLRPKICSSSSIPASSCSRICCSLKWDCDPLSRQFNDCKHVAQVIKRRSGFNLSLNICVLILSSQFQGSCLHRSSVKEASNVRAVSLFLLEAIQSHIDVSLNAGRIRMTFWSSGTPPFALLKKVRQACSNSMISFEVSSPSVIMGGWLYAL